MLQLEDLHAYYGKSHVLRGVTLRLRPGEIVALLGRNGSGRSTLAKAIMGLVRSEGRISWQPDGAAEAVNLVGKATHAIAQLGIGYVPEERAVFAKLTVQQNLLLGQKRSSQHGNRWSDEDSYTLFPRLRERQHTEAGVLSGGEQQMLALCRTMMGDPAVVLVDEPTEGLAPQVTRQVAVFLDSLRARGVAVLLIEQKLSIAMELADRCLVMGHGRIVFAGTPGQLQDNAAVRAQWLQV